MGEPSCGDIPVIFGAEISSRKWSVSSRSSSCKSLLSSSSTSTSSTWAESKGDRKSVLSSSSDNSSTTAERTSGIVDGSWGMVSGSHLFTLGRLYAWEKKLYHEVKVNFEGGHLLFFKLTSKFCFHWFW